MNSPTKQPSATKTQPASVRQAATRLPAHPSHTIDPSQPIPFKFNGKSYTAYAGDSIASALWAQGVRMLGRSFKYHRPRGAFAMTSADSNTMVRVDDEPNVRASVRPVEAGMVVAPQNVFPSLNADLLSLAGGYGSRFMPAGFYYKTFIRPTFMWPMYEAVLRNAAGLGQVTQAVPDVYFDKRYEFADVLVIGGGPAGMSAALSAAQTGARVMLLDENPDLGGHLAYERQSIELAADQTHAAQAAYELGRTLAEQVSHHPNIQLRLNTTAFGIYPHRWVGANQADQRLLKIRAKSLVVANGAFEQPLLFHNNDLPGVIFASAAQRLMHLYGVRPGKKAIVMSANRDGLQAALDLHAAGVKVVMLIELRLEPDADLAAQLEAVGIPLKTDLIVTEAKGNQQLTGVTIAQAHRQTPLKPGGISGVAGSEEFVGCDLLVTSVGWTPATGLLYQAKATFAYDEARAEFLPQTLPPNVHAAGRVNGTHNVSAERLEGQAAGLNAAHEIGFGEGATESLLKQVQALKAAEPSRTSTLIYVPGGKKSFLCFDEDVTIKDLRDSIAEGYKSMELLKRYSTLSMGPSQGKYESANTMALCAEANDLDIAAVGTTTSRPPFSPVPYGVLAGRMMEPVKVSPMHQWHVSQGATMMNVGLWKRPEHYGNPSEEVIGTRTSLGLIDVSTLGKLQLRGKDVPKLLAMLYTNKWSKLKVGRARYGVMCNEEGIVSDDGVAAHLSDDLWYMTATSGGVSAVYENMLWNLQSGWDFEVQVVNLTDTNAAMNFTGPKARQVLQPLTDLDLSNGAFPYMGAQQGRVAGVEAIILRIGFTGELGYELHVPAGHALYLWETLMAAGHTHDIAITPFGVEAQRIMRLEKGHFIVGQDTDGLTDPYMAHLDWAVKMDKADFVGKPSLVRIQQKGIRQKLVGFQMLNPNDLPEEANQIVVPNPDKPIGLEIIGRVTSSRYSPTLKQSIGLCWLPVDRCEPGTEFTVRVRGQLKIGRVVSLPFYDASGARLKG